MILIMKVLIIDPFGRFYLTLYTF